MTSVDFLQAAGAGDVSSLAALLDTGCDPNVVHPTTGATALYNACFASQVEAIQLLLSRGADPNKRITYQSPVDGRIEKGVVALMVASSEAAVALLLQAGADPSVRDDDGRTVLMRLVGAASSKVFDMLIRAGADVTARSSDGRSAADIVTQKLEWWQRFARAKNAEHQADLRQILALLQAGAP
jgi:serine/threonine-protein phosphatase 6 regulatory ankyrin repeat subunit B